MPAPYPSRPPLPTRATRRRNLRHNVVKGTIALTAATAVIGAGILLKACGGDSDPHAGKPAPKAECVDTSKLAAQRSKIFAGLAKSATERTLTWDWATAEETAQANGVHLADTRSDEARIYAKNETLTGKDTAAKVDDVLAKAYNVRLGYGSDAASDTLQSTPYILSTLISTPKELVAVAVNKIDVVSFNPNSPMVEYDDKGVAIGGFTPGARDGGTKSYAWSSDPGYGLNRVVFGMGLHAAACTNPAEDPQFTDLNSPDFKYGKKDRKDLSWQGVTTSIAGAQSAEADYDHVTNALFEPSLEDCKAVAGSTVLQQKMALIAERATALTTPGMENYLAHRFLGECSLNVAAGMTYVQGYN